jgi:hypothetical protein
MSTPYYPAPPSYAPPASCYSSEPEEYEYHRTHPRLSPRGGQFYGELNVDCTTVMAVIFRAERDLPIKTTIAWSIYKTLFIREPHRFTLLKELHQNSPTEPLHFSVEVEIVPGWKHRLHFNGFIREKFRVFSIEACTKERGVYVRETIAEWHWK